MEFVVSEYGLFLKVSKNINKMMKKLHNICSYNTSYQRHLLKFGVFGFKVVSNNNKTTAEQIESIVKVLTKKLKTVCRNNKSYKIWNLILLNGVLTQLSLESRMGKGKGVIKTKASFIKAGTIIFEFSNIGYFQIVEVYSFIKKIVPFRLVLVSKF